MYIGIDYGLRKIGVAYSEGITATPLGIISNTLSRLQQLKEMLPGEPKTIIIGIPHSFLDEAIKTFSGELKAEFNCEVIFQDETRTSKEALTTMIQSGISKKKRQHDDAHAAALILQTYLDNYNEKANT